jgi:hypothetical protein
VTTPAGTPSSARLVGGLRRLAASAPSGTLAAPSAIPRDGERCDLCGTALEADHRHMLELEERRIECTCESCWALRSGDPGYRPVGTRTIWLPDLELSDEAWAGFGIPIGLTFIMRSSTAGRVVALYPSPAGATESEIDPSAWETLEGVNPILGSLEADSEGLVINRLPATPQYAIAPIDRCYLLVGLIKVHWEGLSGGDRLEAALAGFFDDLREAAT